MTNPRIDFIQKYDARYRSSDNPNPAALVALGAAMRLLNPYQWSLIEDTVRDFLPAMYGDIDD